MQPAPWTLYYDEDCGFCLRTARFFERWTFGRIRPAGLTSPQADVDLVNLDPAERFSQSWLVRAGIRHGGHECMWHCLYLLPLGFLFRPLRLLPGFHPLSRRLYRRIADSRNPACRLKASGGH